MSTNTPPAAPQAKADQPRRVFIEIPKAKPGQGYRAPKNYARPLLAQLGRLVIILACLMLPIIPLAIIVMIVVNTYASESYLLWLWITMALIVVPIAIFVAIGLGREAIGVQRASDYEFS
jgi:magnesium-transporting ATPase (P-type)